MEIKGNIAITLVINWLEEMKERYEKQNLIPTLELLIEDLKEQNES